MTDVGKRIGDRIENYSTLNIGKAVGDRRKRLASVPGTNQVVQQNSTEQYLRTERTRFYLHNNMAGIKYCRQSTSERR